MEMEKELEHNKIDCLSCIHKDICMRFNTFETNASIIDSLDYRGDYGEKIKCDKFKHQKYEIWTIDDYKNMLIERINKTDIPGKHLFLINHMLDLAEGK